MIYPRSDLGLARAPHLIGGLYVNEIIHGAKRHLVEMRVIGLPLGLQVRGFGME